MRDRGRRKRRGPASGQPDRAHNLAAGTAVHQHIAKRQRERVEAIRSSRSGRGSNAPLQHADIGMLSIAIHQYEDLPGLKAGRTRSREVSMPSRR